MDRSLDPLLSPSKAKQAARDSRAWSEIDSFLKPLFHPGPIPQFERNPATLSALRSLIAHTEAQTERKILLSRSRSKAVHELRNARNEPAFPCLTVIQQSLTYDGATALRTLATLSLALGPKNSDTNAMAESLLKLTRNEHEVSQQLQRVEILHQQLKLENIRAQELLQRLRTEEALQPSDALVQKTGEWNRGSKGLNMKIGEYKDRAARMERAGVVKPDVGIPEIKGQEKELRELEKRVRGLESKVRGFEGLPPDKDAALAEVERMRRELEGLVRKRDGLFEGLVEK